MTTTVNSKNGPRTHMAFDGWFRYPAGFSESSLVACAEAVGGDSRPFVVGDPFAGVATVGRLCVEQDWVFRGIETHPLIARMAQLKFERPGPPAELLEAAKAVVADAEPGDVDSEHELVRRTFDPAILSVLGGIRDQIATGDPVWRGHLEIALLSILRDHASVKVGWPYQLPRKPRQPRSTDPLRRFVERAQRIAVDLDAVSAGDARVLHGDSRDASSWMSLHDQPLDAVITSPPYLNNFDYADATRLELYFLKRVSTWAEMCREVRSGMVIASTQQSRIGEATAARNALRESSLLHAQLDPKIDELLSARSTNGRRSGKRYDWLVPLYFRDLRRVFQNIAAQVRPGGRIAMVVGDSAPYGIYLDTPGLLALMANDLGFSTVSSSVLRARGQRWRTNASRHQVDLCERLVVLEAPSC